MMELIMMEEPCWAQEVIACLHRIEENSVSDVLDHHRRYNMEQEEIKKMLSAEEAFYDAVQENVAEIAANHSLIKPYCRYLHTKEYGWMAEYLVELFVGITDTETLPDKDDKVLEKDIREAIGKIVEELNGQEKAFENNIPEDLTEIISILSSAEIEDKVKMLLINLYSDRRNIYQDLCGLIADVVPVLKEYFYLVEPDFENWKKNILKRNIEKMLGSGELGIKLNDIDGKTYLICRILQFNSFGVSIIENRKQVISLGLYYLILSAGSQIRIEDSLLVEVLKLIGEPSRFKMLRLISEKKSYLQELSRELKLTPATISHHITALLEKELIQVSIDPKQKKVIYYELNRAFIRRLSIALEELAETEEREE